MAHVTGAGTMAAAGQQAAKAMEHGMEGMMKNMMMGEGMACMMKNMPMGEGMAGMMKNMPMGEGMAGMMKNMPMGEGMTGMMKNMAMGEGMAGMMGQGMAKAAPAATSFHNVAKGAAATGAAATAGSKAGRSLAGRLVRNPWVLFGLGVTVGYFVHKYRKDILAAATRVTEKGKDFVLQQRENLEDIVAESHESED